jgi:hypothetical protein
MQKIGLVSTGCQGETPLWYYILPEADAREGGHRLGPIGGRIVANVLVGLVNADTESFRRAGDGWHPQTTLSDLLTPVPWVKQPPRTS